MTCFEATAKATGCTFEPHEPSPHYRDFVSNPFLADLYEANDKSLDIAFEDVTFPGYSI